MTVAVGIATLAVLVAGWIVWLFGRAGSSAARAATLVIVVMAVEYVLAVRGILANWQHVPPPILPVVAGPVVLAIVTAFSPVGGRAATRLSFAQLIGYQAFRLPLELVMHQAAVSGLMPEQMSFTGRNFDILTGVLAIPVAIAAARGSAPRWLIVAWNAVGTLLLANIVAIAVASMPMLAVFGPDRLNTWIADPPYIWLPGVLVPSALLGHLVLWRKLARPTDR
jgi:hypothetical protein